MVEILSLALVFIFPAILSAQETSEGGAAKHNPKEYRLSEYDKKYHLDFSKPDFNFDRLIADYNDGAFRNLGGWLAKLYEADPIMFRYPVFNFLTRAPQHPPRVFFVSSNGKLTISISLGQKTDSVDVIHVEHNLNKVPIMRPHEFFFGGRKPVHTSNPMTCHNCHGTSSRDERIFTYRFDGYNSWPRMIGSITDPSNDQPEAERKAFVNLLKQNANHPALQYTFREWKCDSARFDDDSYVADVAKKLHLISKNISLNRATFAMMIWNFHRMAGLIRSHAEYPKYEAAILRSLKSTIKLEDEEFVEEKNYNTTTFPATDLAELFGPEGSSGYKEFLARYEKRFMEVSATEHKRSTEFKKLVEHFSGALDATPSLHVVPAARLATVLSFMNIELGDLSMSTQTPSYDFSTPVEGLTREFLEFLTSDEIYSRLKTPLSLAKPGGDEILKANCVHCHSDQSEKRGPLITDWKGVDRKKLHLLLTTDEVDKWMPKGYSRLQKEQVEGIMRYVENLSGPKRCETSK